MKTLASGVGAVLLILSAGCGREQESTATVTDRLNGIWTVELTELSPGQASPPDTVPQAIGEIALLHNEEARPRAGLDAAPTHSGTFAIRANILEIDIGANGSELVAHLSTRDSIEIVLQPRSDGPIRMQGRVADDSIYGQWSRSHARGRTASGSFIMRRSDSPSN